MQAIEYVPCGTYYVPFNSRLIQFRIESITFVPDAPLRRSVTYKGSYQNDTLIFAADTKFYNSGEDYFNGNPVPCCTLTRDFICRKFGCLTSGEEFTGWILTDKLAEQVFFSFSEIKYANGLWIFTPVGKDGCIFHEEVYRTRQELLDNNIVRVINGDGTETEVEGAKIRLRFSDEQEQLIARFRELASQMYDAGIAICFDDDEFCLRAFNFKNFPDAEQIHEGDEDNFERVVGSRDLQRICSVDFTTYENRCIGLSKKQD